jgi:hypothetical protein
MFRGHAEAHFSQQNKKGRPETIQDHGHRQGFAFPLLSAASPFLEARETQTATGKDGERRQDRRRAC